MARINTLQVASDVWVALATGNYALVKSLQRGTIVIAAASSSNTATITSVSTSKSHLVLLGSTNDSGAATAADLMVRMDITNATTITARRTTTTGNTTVGYEVVEFY